MKPEYIEEKNFEDTYKHSLRRSERESINLQFPNSYAGIACTATAP